jgi:N-acylglucosamine 2-epimerase
MPQRQQQAMWHEHDHGPHPMNGSRGKAPGNLPIEELQTRYRRELFEEVMPFWDRHGIDHELGGVMCALDLDGTLANTHKFLWFQGRTIWVYTRLYNAFGGESRWLTSARQAVEFSLRHLRQPDGSWAELVTREGAVIERGGASPRFGPFFMAEGLQEFAAATGDAAMHAMSRDLLSASSREATASSRVQQPAWFLTLLVCTQMLARRPDPELEALAARASQALLTDHHNSETGLNDEVVGTNGARTTDHAAFTIFGHSIEALWMVLDEAVRRQDAAVVDLCAARIRRHLDVGWDRVFGGLCHAVRVDAGGAEWPVERPVGTGLEFRFTGEYHYMKTFWSLAEALVAVLKVLEQRPDTRWAREWFGRIQRTLDEQFSLRAHGSPFYRLFAGRRIERAARVPRQDNYHHPRMLMLALKSLEAIRAAGVRAI